MDAARLTGYVHSLFLALVLLPGAGSAAAQQAQDEVQIRITPVRPFSFSAASMPATAPGSPRSPGSPSPPPRRAPPR